MRSSILKMALSNALIVQQPYEMGRLAVEYINDTLNGEEVPAETATEVVVVTQENMNDPDIQAVLYPLEQNEAAGEDAEAKAEDTSTEESTDVDTAEDSETVEEAE